MAKKVLIVDDDRFISEVYRLCLANAGYEVEVASDGQAALDRLPVFRPDALLLDLMMPRIGGIATLKHLRSSGEFKTLPVIVSTNVFVPAMIKRAFEAGATKVFNKATLVPPLLLASLRETVAAEPTLQNSGEYGWLWPEGSSGQA